MDALRQLDHLDEAAVRRFAADTETCALQHLAKFGIELVAMPVALADLTRAAIDFARETVGRKPARPRAQTHRAAHLFDADQIAQLEDDRIRRLWIKLCRVGV